MESVFREPVSKSRRWPYYFAHGIREEESHRPIVLQRCSSASRRYIPPRAARHRRKHGSTFDCDSNPPFPHCAWKHYTNIPDAYMLLPPPTSMSCKLLAFNASRSRQELACKCEGWQAMLPAHAPPVQNDKKNNRRTECTRPVAVRLSYL